MSVDIRDLSGANVNRLTRLLSRRPEYGIAMPSRRWLSRQEEKLATLPSELLYTPGPLKRLFIKIADSFDANVVDPRAVLCKTHARLNPFLIRRLFLAVAYEVTVYTDTIRTWKDRKDSPIISAFVGRVDAIAALWTEPELYRECYGTPPFENHMVFVKSGCEACILSALGANARVLADLRSVLIDRVERRTPRTDGRPNREPRLTRYVNEWIDHLKEERATKCREISDNVLTELRARRPQLIKWRNKRKKERLGTKGGKKPAYTQLTNTGSGHQLSTIPGNSPYRRRTRNGIPVATVDLEGAEEQRRMAMFSMTKEAEGEKSIFRPDSMCDTSRFGPPRMAAYDPTNSMMNGEQQGTPSESGATDIQDDHDEAEGEVDIKRSLEEEEQYRSRVTDWYATRLAHADLSADDTKSVLSAVHPAFQPPKSFSHFSAAPPPLRPKKDQPASIEPLDNQSIWTDVTAHTIDEEMPSVPNQCTLRRSSSVRAPKHRSARLPNRPASQNCQRFTASSSVYSERPPPSSIAPLESRFPASKHTSMLASARQLERKFLFDDVSEAGSRAPASQSQQRPPDQKSVKNSSRRSTPRPSKSTSKSASRSSSRVPSLASSRGTPVPNPDDLGPRTPPPVDDMWRPGLGLPDGASYADGESLGPDDSLTVAGWAARNPNADEFSPWGQFARKGAK